MKTPLSVGIGLSLQCTGIKNLLLEAIEGLPKALKRGGGLPLFQISDAVNQINAFIDGLEERKTNTPLHHNLQKAIT